MLRLRPAAIEIAELPGEAEAAWAEVRRLPRRQAPASGVLEPIEVASAGDLSLAIRGPADAPCVEVLRGEGMGGGCGAGLTRPLDFGVGAVGVPQTFLVGGTSRRFAPRDP